MKTETYSSTVVRGEIEALRHMTGGQLKDQYRDVFGEASRSNRKQFLFRPIACRIQANAGKGSRNAPAAARSKSPTIPICGSALPKNFLKEDLDETPHDRGASRANSAIADRRHRSGPPLSRQGHRGPRSGRRVWV
jgi:hypothetical protein